MKKKNVLFPFLFIFVLGITTCYAGVVKKSRQVGSFTKISVNDGVDVYFTQKNVQNIEVEADETIIENVITQVEGNKLVIKREKNIVNFKKTLLPVKVYVSAPVLEDVSASGGADFHIDNLSCDKSFNVNASGGADIYIDHLDCNESFHGTASGGADFKLDKLNIAGSTRIDVSGGSDCSIKLLQTTNCNLSASGGGDLNIELNAENLKASASGGSDIKLTGKAIKVSVSVSGGSDINVKKLTYKEISSEKSGGGDIHK